MEQRESAVLKLGIRVHRMAVEADSPTAGELALPECRNVGHHRGGSPAGLA